MSNFTIEQLISHDAKLQNVEVSRDFILPAPNSEPSVSSEVAKAPESTDITCTDHTKATSLLVESHEVRTLAIRVEQLHRSSQALRILLQRTAQNVDNSVTIAPRLAVNVAKAGNARKVLPAITWPSHPWWTRASLPSSSLQPPPGLTSFSLCTQVLDVWAVSVLGLRGVDLEHAVVSIVEAQRQNGNFKPIFLTDSPDFGPMTQHGYAVEFAMPSDGPTDDIGLPSDLRAFLTQKWGVSRFLDLRQTRALSVLSTPPMAAVKELPPTAGKRKRAAVISWDLGHNPAGRAMVIYDLLERDWDVELVGPLWSRFGGKVWGPIANSSRKVRGFACDTLEQFWPAALAIASAADYDLVVVCKPRLPALLLGALLKKACNCPVVLDVDDFELSFFPDETNASLDELEAGGSAALIEPYGELATRACEGVIADSDALIVSNVALRQRYGGTIVRHARDENLFRSDRFDRVAERNLMGITEDDFALVFVGTARAHKGVFQIAKTLADLADKRFVLHIVGDIPDRRVRNELESHRGARIVFHPDCDFDALPSKIVAADAVVLLQDVAHPISQFQIPAKVSDASAFGLPILMTDVPPTRDLAMQGIVTTIGATELGASLTSLLLLRETGKSSRDRSRVREAFEAELGFRVNRERLDLAVQRATATGPGLPPSYQRLIDIATVAYAALRKARGSSEPVAAVQTHPVQMSDLATVPATARTPIDLVMFWKQNDTGLYGRRSDMMMKHLLASGRVGRVLQFDAPLEVTDLARSAHAVRGAAAGLILANTIDNQFHLRDHDHHHLRTFIFDRRARSPVLPQVGSRLADYPAYVEAQMAQSGLRPENTLAWVCPVVFDFPAVAQHIPFRGIIGDLIDDQRNFEMSPIYRERIVANYAEILPLLDLTITNCAPLAEAFGTQLRKIQVIPNGTELIGFNLGPIPAALARLPRPIAGYVGNLRDRVDWKLLREAALTLPGVTFAIVGGGGRERDLELLEGLPNVVFTGVVPYDQVQACIHAFDVALVPHTRDRLTSSMNPLKIYNYFAARRPIVATEVDNVDAALRPYIRFARDGAEFAVAISAALANPIEVDGNYDSTLSGITWKSRAQAVLESIDRWMAIPR